MLDYRSKNKAGEMDLAKCKPSKYPYMIKIKIYDKNKKVVPN